jgi:hypothetical protein
MTAMSATSERRFREMMRRQRVDVLELCYDHVGATFETARRVCEQCENVGACQAWLGSDVIGETPAFCPNCGLFEQFKA